MEEVKIPRLPIRDKICYLIEKKMSYKPTEEELENANFVRDDNLLPMILVFEQDTISNFYRVLDFTRVYPKTTYYKEKIEF